MARLDVEDILDLVETILKSNLNPKIVSIEAEKTAKGKGIGLSSVSSDAYFRQLIDPKIINYSPAIFYGLEDMQSSGNQGATAKALNIFVEIVISNNDADGRDADRILRYARALEEIFQVAFQNYPLLANFIVNQVRPVNFRLSQDSADEVKVGGITIKGAIF